MSSESLTDLLQKLGTYRAQLQQVRVAGCCRVAAARPDWGCMQLETLLAGDPSNATLLKLKQDLMEVIGLTQDLVRKHCLPAMPATPAPCAYILVTQINMKTSGAAPDSEPAAAPFSVGDVVEAKYMEHYFYPGALSHPAARRALTPLRPHACRTCSRHPTLPCAQGPSRTLTPRAT